MPSPAPTILARLHALLARAGEPIPRGSTPDEIARAQRDLGLAFPPELVEWLTLCGDARFPDGERLAGLPSWVPATFLERGLIPVADDACGDFWCIALKSAGCPVVYVEQHDPEHEDNYLAASGLWPFLAMLIEQHETGEEPAWSARARHLRADPAIAGIDAIRGFPRVWDA